MTYDRIYRQRLEAFRAALKAQNLDGFILPRADVWPGEFVRDCAERVAWLSGFTGSGGTLVVLTDRAAALTHSLYTLQIRRQVDPSLFDIGDLVKTPPVAWIVEHAPRSSGDRKTVIGYDPWLYTAPQVRLLSEALSARDILLRPVEENPVDSLWTDRPPSPDSVVEKFPDAIAGRSSEEKCEQITRFLTDKGGQALLIAAPDCIAWLLNIRGRDVSQTPVALSFALLHDTGAVDWFIDPARVPGAVRDSVGSDVRILAPDLLGATLDGLTGKIVLMDESRTPAWVSERMARAQATIRPVKDPCILPKACKTASEQAAIVEAHRRDGLAMIRLLAWIDRVAPSGDLDEMAIGQESIRLRAEAPGFQGVSFPPIVAFGPNAALPHYRAVPETNVRVQADGILLIDSGGQYLDALCAGTTDITRTLAIGKPSMDMKRHNTLVLKGHIAVARAVFPEGTTGAQMDALARKALWEHGLDYLHRTGHGVGIYLGVHEDAAGIGPKEIEPFQPGMLISNEPGYYREGAYGIRIESLVLVETADRPFEDGRQALRFKTITMVPLDRRLVLTERLSAEERGWINGYHAQVLALYRNDLTAEDRTWLEAACAPL